MMSVGTLSAANAEKITYTDHIRPLFQDNCFKCHNPDKEKGGLNLTTMNAVLAGGGSGEVVVPGDPDDSLLYLVMTHEEEPTMPPKASKRPDTELSMVRQWIAGGLLEHSSSVARKARRPTAALAQVDISAGCPKGPAPMPVDLPLEPVHVPSRADAIVALAANPWAPVIAVGGENQVLLHHSETRELVGVLPFPEGAIYDLRFSRNGQLLLVAGGTAGRDGVVALMDARSGERLGEWASGYDAVLSADLRADHREIVTGGSDKRIRIVDVASGQELHKIKKHTEWVTAVAYSPDGVLLATGDRNGNLHVWEAGTAQAFYTLKGHSKQITELAWRRDSNIMASASEDGTIRLWSMHNGREARKWSSHGGVLAIDFLPDGRLVTCGRDNVARVWDGNGKEQTKFEMTSLPVQVRAATDSKTLLIGDYAGAVQVADVTGKILGAMDMLPPRIDTRLTYARTAQTQALAEQKAGIARLVESEQAHKQALAKRDQCKTGRDTSQTNLERAVKSLSDLEGMLAKNDGPMDAAAKAAKNARQNAEHCKQALAGAVATREVLLEEIEKLIQEMASIPTNLPAVNLDTKNQEVERVTATVASKTQAHETALEQLQTAESALAGVSAERVRLTQEADVQRQAVEQLDPELAAAETALVAAAAELAKRNEAMASHRKAKATSDTHLESAKARVARWEAAAFNLKVHAAKAVLQDKASALQDHEDAVKQAHTARDSAAQDLSKQKSELDALQKAYKAMKAAPTG